MMIIVIIDWLIDFSFRGYGEFWCRFLHFVMFLRPVQPPPVPPRPGGVSPPVTLNGNGVAHTDLIILDPFAVKMTPDEDPFGDFHKLFTGPDHGNAGSTAQLDDAIQKVDQRMLEMRVRYHANELKFRSSSFSTPQSTNTRLIPILLY